MNSYKQRYHLKKTEPISNKNITSQLSYSKQPAKKQQNPNIHPGPRYKRKTLRERYSNKLLPLNNDQKALKVKNRQLFKEKVKSQGQVDEKSDEKVPKTFNDDNKSSSNSVSKPIIEASEVKNIHLSRYQIAESLVPPIPYRTSLNFHKKEEPLFNFKIISSVQDFFNNIAKSQNGCVCQEPCQWASKFVKWVDIPDHIINQHYQNLLRQVRSGENIKKHIQSAFDCFEQEQSFQKQQERLKNFKQIEKDVLRTQSTEKTFMNPVFHQKIDNILKCYVVEDLKVGYVQGMNMILSGILYHVKQQPKSYAVFRKLLYSIRSLYLNSFAECYIHINRIQELIKVNINDVYESLKAFEIDLSMICLPWIISLLSSIVPLDSLHLVYFGFIRDRWNFIYRSSLSIFIYFKQEILEAEDASEVLILMSSSQQLFKSADWEEIIRFGEKLTLSFT